MSRSILILTCLGAVLLAAGCGGSSSHGLSEAAFRSQANHICSDLTRREKPDLASTAKASVDRNLDRIDSAVSKLEALDPPTRDETRYQALLTSFKRSVAFVRANERRLITMTQRLRANPSDSRTTAQYQHLVRPFVQDVQRAGTDANALGLTTCANGLSGGSGGQSSP